MKVFVTGANGLLGSFVVKRLLSLGHEPHLLLRSKADTQLISNELSRCTIVEGDLLDYALLTTSFKNCDMVIHCAGKVSFDPGKTKEIFEVNVQGTANVVNACLQSGVKKLVHISSIAALGRKHNSLEINEKTKWEENALNSSYAKSKYLAELEVFRGGEEGLDYSIVNPSIVIGPGDLGRSSTKLLAFVKKMPWFYPAGYLNVVDVRDVANVVCDLLTVSHRDRLVLNSTSVSYKEFYGLVRQAYGITSPLWQIPTFMLKFIAFFDRIRTLFAGGEPLVTKESIKLINKRHVYNSLYYNKLFTQPFISPQESVAWSVKELRNRNS